MQGHRRCPGTELPARNYLLSDLLEVGGVFKYNNHFIIVRSLNYGHNGGSEKAEAARYAFIYEHLGVKPISILK